MAQGRAARVVIEHDLRQRGSVEAAVRLKDGVAEALLIAGSVGLPGAVTSRASWSASTTVPPSPASIWPTVDLPQPIGPVSPMSGGLCDGHLGACSASVSHASSACARAASTSASFTRQPPQLDEIGLHARIAEGELELALAQPQSRQVVLHEQLASLVRVLRERCGLWQPLACARWSCA
jgi:hypothetical protein